MKDIEEIPDDVIVNKRTTIATPGYKEPQRPKSPKQIDYTPRFEISYEDMRRDRIKQRIAQRSVKIQNLFSNAIQFNKKQFFGKI